MRVLCFGYRSWAINIYNSIREKVDSDIIITDSRDLLNINVLESLNPSIVLFYGWSWFVPKSIIDKYPCFMLHPSSLPKYRGGSPIQNQVLDGLKRTEICLFKMNDGIDEGPIYGRRDLDLSGEVSDIFRRMECQGLELTQELLQGELASLEQKTTGVSHCTRRTPDQSEIKRNDFFELSGEELYNKIRCLTDPYPNAFIRTRDGKRLLIKSVELIDQ